VQVELYEFVGGLAFYAAVIILALLLVTVALLAVSLRRHRYYFPNFTIAVLIFFQGFFKAVFRLLRLDDTVIDQLYIDVTLTVKEKEFFAVPHGERALFFPQCLRSVECPAPLTPEGIMCEQCGKCRLSEVKQLAEELGCMFFIVPGSSFIIRAVAKHRPRAVLGVGCLAELKEGAEMTQRFGLPSYGVQLERAGCINTTVDWDRVFEVLNRYDGGKSKRKKRGKK